LQPEEGPERIKAALGSGLPVERAPIQPAEMGGMEELVSIEGDLRTLPSHFAGKGGMDGFFAARLKRL
jgi:16S rRNA (cytosine967-C5)-methyltransferase